MNGCTVCVQSLIFAVPNDLLIRKWGLAKWSVETAHSDNCYFCQATLPFTAVSRRITRERSVGDLRKLFSRFSALVQWLHFQLCVLEASLKEVRPILEIVWLPLLRIQHGQNSSFLPQSWAAVCGEELASSRCTQVLSLRPVIATICREPLTEASSPSPPQTPLKTNS